jgi:hypothetical protein
MVGGAIGNGQFALFLRSIFLTGLTTFTPVADVKLKGHPSYGFDYVVPQARSAFRIESSSGQATVGFSGRSSADPGTLELIVQCPQRYDLRALSRVCWRISSEAQPRALAATQVNLRETARIQGA